jgi:hypothetical protein
MYSLIFILFILWVIVFIGVNSIFLKRHVERFENEASKKYLYPIKGLTDECSSQNLRPAYMPQICYVDGKLNSYANCKCQDKEGNCKICYDTLENDKQGPYVVYDAMKHENENT